MKNQTKNVNFVKITVKDVKSHLPFQGKHSCANKTK